MLETVLDYIARTNLFNFIIFAGIIVYVILKLDVASSIKEGTEAVAENIDKSEAAKTDAENNLQTIEDKVSHLEEEVSAIIKQSEANAELVGGQIISDANKSAENIKLNSAKLIENKTGVLKNEIMRRASLASVEVAKEHIISELNNNYDLHNKLIDESIEAINEVGL